ncbi:Ig-like domain-containing protein [candidate division KSB1 bacterium]|nr:Ig-like domain-containing protein [candidate division KSB1 bacterium]
MKNFFKLIFLVIVLEITIVGWSYSQIKIMPLGDSITSGKAGSTTVGGYRDDLARLLTQEGINYDFVGSLSDGTGFDNNHEGHDGKTTEYINSNIAGWLTSVNPDIVLLHIGTNDVQGTSSIETTRNNINAIIDKIYTHNQNITIVISSLIPRKDGYDSTTTNLNDLILESFYNHVNSGHKIRYAGHNEVFKGFSNWQTQLMNSADNIHPNDTGYEVMANVFAAAVMNIINSSGKNLTDNFNRQQLSTVWIAHPDFKIQGNELANTSTLDAWDQFLAVYGAQVNPTEVSIRWGNTANSVGIHDGGLALLLDRPGVTANGYLILIRNNGYINLWTIRNGLPGVEKDYKAGLLPQPGPGDEFKVVMTSNAGGHHFQCFINGQETGVVSDPLKTYGTGTKLYAGVMLKGAKENNIDNFNLLKEGDTIAPNAINDLAIINQSTSSMMLQWTVPGDDGNTGLASSYEIRYSKANITEANFNEAMLAVDLPLPVEPGTLQTFVVSGLSPSTSYFFAIKTLDEAHNVAPLSNITSGATISALQSVDNFNRSALGSEWSAEPVFRVENGQLVNYNGGNLWDYIAVYNVKKNPVEAWMQWAKSSNVDGIARGAIVFLDNNSPAANGYMIWIREADKYLSLWTVVNGVPEKSVINRSWPDGPFTAPGDTFKVAITRDVNGNHFDLYKNKKYLARLSDPSSRQLKNTRYFAGVMLHGGMANNVEAFGVATQVGKPSTLEYIAGNNQSGPVNLPLPDSLMVKVIDQDGNPIQGVTVDYRVISGKGSLDLQRANDNNIRIQAEMGALIPPMQIFKNDPNASGGKYITAPSGDPGDGRASYQIYIKEAGEYIVWCRVLAPSADNNSFFFIMDGGEKITWDIDYRQTNWYWDRVSNRGNGTESKPQFDPVKFYLTAGLHTFIVEEREFNTRIDNILLTKDTQFQPQDKEEFDEYVTNNAGIAAAQYTFGPNAGPEIVEAAVPGLAGSPIQFSLKAIASSPAILMEVSGNQQSGKGGEQLKQPFVVKVTDNLGNPVQNIPVIFKPTVGGGFVSDPQPQYTNETGQVSTFYTMGSEALENQIKVMSDSIQNAQVIFKAKLLTGLADQLLEVSGNHQSGPVMQKLSEPLIVKVLTTDNLPIKNHHVNFKVTRGDGTFDGISLKETTFRTDEQGIAKIDFYIGKLTDTTKVRVSAINSAGALKGSPIIFDMVGQPELPSALKLVSGHNQTGAAGSPLREPLKVKVIDKYNNPVSAHPVLFTILAGGGNIEGKVTVTKYTEANGEAAVYLTLGPDPKVKNRVQASAEYNQNPLTGSPRIFEAISGEVAKIEYVSGNDQRGSAGYELPEPFKVRILDSFGNPVPLYPVDFLVLSGDGHFNTTHDTTLFTDFDGIGQVNLTLGVKPDQNYKVEARAFKNGVPLVGNPISFIGKSSALEKIEYVSGNNQTGDAAKPLAEPLRVKVLDKNNLGIAGQTVRFEVIQGGGNLGGKRQLDVLTNKAGIAEVQFILGNVPGDSNNVVHALATFNGTPLTNSPIKFVASTRIGKGEKLVIVSNYLVGVVGNALSEPLKVKVLDLGGNPVSNFPVKFKIEAGGGHFTNETSKDVSTGINGIAEIIMTLGPATGDTNNIVQVSAKRDDKHLTGSPAILKASARASAATQLVMVSGNNQTGIAGKPLNQPLVVKVADNAGNGVADHPVTFQIKAGKGTLGGISDTLKVINTDKEGKASVVYHLSPRVTDNNVVQAFSTNGNKVLTGSPVTFSAKSAAGLVSIEKSKIEINPAELPADGEMTAKVIITLLDDFGNPVKDKKVQIKVTGENNTINPAQATSNQTGIVTFNIKSTQSGLKFVTVEDVTDKVTLNTRGRVRFTALDPTRIDLYAGNGQFANIGTAVAQPLQVIIYDKYRNPVPNYPVNFKITGGGGYIYEPNPVLSDTNGIISGTLVVGTTVGLANTVDVIAEKLSNSPIHFMATTVKGTAKKIEMVSGNNQTAMGGTILPQSLVVKVVDDKGNAIYDHPVKFTVHIGKGTIDGQSSKNVKTNEFGQASIQFMLSQELGMNIVRAVADGLTGSPISFVENAAAGKAAIVKIVGGNNQTASINSYLAEPMQVQVTDLNGNGVAGHEVHFKVLDGDAQLLESQPQISAADGIVRSSLKIGKHARPIRVEANAGELIYSPLHFTIKLIPIKPTQMAIVGGNEQQGTVGRELVFPFEVQITDDYQNPVEGIDITFAVIEGGGRLLDGQISFSDSNGIARNRLLLDTNPVLNKVYAIKSGLKNTPLTFTATGVKNKFPLIKAISDTIIKEQQSLKIKVLASDEDGETIRYRATNIPYGATFDSTGSHEFKWIPTLKQSGVYLVQFWAFDPRGGLDAETVKIQVRNNNRPPKIIAKSPVTVDLKAPKHDTLNFQIMVQDPDEDPLRYRWYQVFKNRMTLVSTRSIYRFVSDEYPAGDYSIRAVASDGVDSVKVEWNLLWTTVDLTNFSAELESFNNVCLKWETRMAVNHAGFNIWRSTSADGTYQRINFETIPGQDDNRYEYLDKNVLSGKTYFYKLEDIDTSGKRTFHESISLTVLPPKKVELGQNYPNPFNAATWFRYQIPTGDRVRLSVYNLLGQEIIALVQEKQPAGFYTIQWDGTNREGVSVASGIYIYRLQVGNFVQTRRMVLLK